MSNLDWNHNILKLLRFVSQTVLVLLVTLATSGSNSQGLHRSSDLDATIEDYVALVAELELRRRVNVLFPNPQSLFDGFQVGFVNVGSGNLTFIRRDLVVAAQDSPLVFSRIYDSRIEANGEFGRGWRLNLLEELRFDEDGSLVYVDGSGSHYRFDGTSTLYRPVVNVAETQGASISLHGELAVLKLDQGRRNLTFKQLPGKPSLQLIQVDLKPGKTLEYAYSNGKLTEVTERGATLLKIKRNSDGKIESVTDRHHRMVQYRYSAKGLLTDVRDVAGDWWLHEYAASGVLAGLVGGNGKLVLNAYYDIGGRVSQIHSGHLFQFKYHGHRTVVSDGSGQTHTFMQNEQGATTSWRSTSGRFWELVFDDDNRVRTLIQPNMHKSYEYDEAGSVIETREGSNVLIFDYDRHGRLVGRTGSFGDSTLSVSYHGVSTLVRSVNETFEFDQSRGLVSSVKDDTGRIDVERNRQGYVTGMHDGQRPIRFERDDRQRIVATHYAGGFVSRYRYDLLGNRIGVDHSLGSSVRYRHDRTGNIIEITVENADGDIKNQLIEIGEMNRVEQVIYGDESRPMRMTYDGLGRPTVIQLAKDTIDIVYFEDGQSMELRSRETGESWHGLIPSDHAEISEDRNRVLRATHAPSNQAGHRTHRFDELSFAVEDISPLKLNVPGWPVAQATLSLGSALLRTDDLTATTEFEKPSNPVFQPPEYRSTNCCIPCSVNHCNDCVINGQFGSWHLCYCESETLLYGIGNVGGGGSSKPDDEPDELDLIIKEYTDLKLKHTPQRSDFVKNKGSANFSYKEYKTEKLDYYIIGSMPEMAETIRAVYNELIDNDPSTDYGLFISSGYRNPKRNKEVGGATESKHQYGRAIDLDVANLPPGYDEEKALERLADAALKVYPSKGSTHTVLVYPTHIHVQDNKEPLQ